MWHVCMAYLICIVWCCMGHVQWCAEPHELDWREYNTQNAFNQILWQMAIISCIELTPVYSEFSFPHITHIPSRSPSPLYPSLCLSSVFCLKIIAHSIINTYYMNWIGIKFGNISFKLCLQCASIRVSFSFGANHACINTHSLTHTCIWTNNEYVIIPQQQPFE